MASKTKTSKSRRFRQYISDESLEKIKRYVNDNMNGKNKQLTSAERKEIENRNKEEEKQKKIKEEEIKKKEWTLAQGISKRKRSLLSFLRKKVLGTHKGGKRSKKNKTKKNKNN